MSRLGLRNPTKKPDKAGVTQDKTERPDVSGLGPNMSELGLWNPNKEPDKAERPDMSRLGAGHVLPEPLQTGLGAGYV
jgi:hypothetical protein